MPSVCKDRHWVRGHMWNANYSIGGDGQYSCKLPEPLADLAGKKKLVSTSLNVLKGEVGDLLKQCKGLHPDEL